MEKQFIPGKGLDAGKEVEVYEHQSISQLKRRIGDFMLKHGEVRVYPTYRYVVSIETYAILCSNPKTLHFTAIEEV